MEIKEVVLGGQLPAAFFTATSTEFGLETLAESAFADQVLFLIDSTLDQPVTAQIIGHRRNDARDAAQQVAVGASVTIAAGNSTPQHDSIGLALSDGNWHRWVGINITTGATAPTTGLLEVVAALRIPGSNGGSDPAILDLVSQVGQAVEQMVQNQADMKALIEELIGRPIPRTPLISLGRRPRVTGEVR